MTLHCFCSNGIVHRSRFNMKTRQLIRKQGWIPVVVDATYLDRSYYPSAYKTILEEDRQNALHYQEIIDWCKSVAGDSNFVSAIHTGGASHNQKRVIFKYARHATMFRLKWLWANEITAFILLTLTIWGRMNWEKQRVGALIPSVTRRLTFGVCQLTPKLDFLSMGFGLGGKKKQLFADWDGDD